MAQMYREALQCESLRAEVFAGKRSPVIFGEPPEWMALLIESLLVRGTERSGEAQSLRARAFEAAPPTAGSIDGQPFEWIADADMRLGPVCEAVINGRYYWVPFDRLSRIDLEAPADLRDVVWMPAHFQFGNGGEAVGLIPTRYPESESSDDAQVRLARKTVWREEAPEVFVGLGQRVLATDAGEHPIMDLRTIVLGARAPATRAPRMPELTPQERLQPALLDRLTDDEPERQQEPRERRVMTKSRLRQAVLRDLAWLFNATRLEGTVDLSGLTEVRRSVINFGLPALAGRAASSMDVAALERAIRQAILDYEPRILAGYAAGDGVARTAVDRPPQRHRRRDSQRALGAAGAARAAGADRNRSRDGEGPDRRSAADAERVMDPRLLEYYNVELQHLREMGAEFAPQFPKIAARLGMNGLEVADPYVERLIEGVAFLAARVQLKLNAEFPRFTQALLDIVYPHYLAPTPAMLVAQLQPDPNDPNLAASKTVPRGTSMTAMTGRRRSDRLRFPHRSRRGPLAHSDHRRELLFVRARSAAERAAARPADQGRRPHPPEDGRGAQVRAAAARSPVVLRLRRRGDGQQAP